MQMPALTYFSRFVAYKAFEFSNVIKQRRCYIGLLNAVFEEPSHIVLYVTKNGQTKQIRITKNNWYLFTFEPKPAKK